MKRSFLLPFQAQKSRREEAAYYQLELEVGCVPDFPSETRKRRSKSHTACNFWLKHARNAIIAGLKTSTTDVSP